MLKKMTSYLGLFALICFSFYYTDRAVDIVKRNDPIMKSILKNQDNFIVDPVNAIINDDEIISGLNGKKINVNESYSNMKKVNKYSDTLLVFEEITPSIGLEYDKYIVKGNEEKNQVSLVFKVDDTNNLDKVSSILLEKNVLATFFIDGYVVQGNMNKVVEMASDGYEIENLGYEGSYKEEKFKWTNQMINSLTNKETSYCYTEYKLADILNLCSNHKMYTIKPTINANNYPFLTVKKSLNSGSIISFNLSDKTMKELPSIISYIKQRGYEIVTLNELISENLVEEK